MLGTHAAPPPAAVKVTSSPAHSVMVAGALIAVPWTCKVDIGGVPTLTSIMLLNSSQRFPPNVLLAFLTKKVVVLIAEVGVYTSEFEAPEASRKDVPNVLDCH